jgi:hypothetical protein
MLQEASQLKGKGAADTFNPAANPTSSASNIAKPLLPRQFRRQRQHAVEVTDLHAEPYTCAVAVLLDILDAETVRDELGIGHAVFPHAGRT